MNLLDFLIPAAHAQAAGAPAPQGGGQSRGEGSVLGGLGRMLDGDNRF